MKLVRVVIEPTVDNPEVPPINLDLVLTDTNEIAGKYPLLGMQGRFGSAATDECWPFVLNRNGTVDWGSGYDRKDNERSADLDICDDIIVINRLITLKSQNYGTQTFRIARIDPLV